MPDLTVVHPRQTFIAGVILTLALGTTLAGHGVYLAAKAQLAQMLLNHAWSQTRENGDPRRPWLWADTHPVARLVVPKHGIEQIVLAGSSGRVLAFGPGHVAGTAPPGDGGLSIVSGHRDTHFSFLEKLSPGDELRIERARSIHRYQVEQTLVLDLHRHDFAADPSQDQLVLVTCYPFDALNAGGSERYLVIARRTH